MKKPLQIAINIICSASWLMIMAAIFYLYYCYVYKSGVYQADIGTHMAMALEENSAVSYSLENLVIRLLMNIFHTKMTVVLWLTAIQAAACWVNAGIAYRFLGKGHRECFPVFLLLGTLPLFLGAIYLPGIYEYHYLGTLTSTVWHNDTVIVMRFFAVITLLFLAKVMRGMAVKGRVFWRSWVLFVGFLFLTVGFKPNFYFSFAILAGVVLLVRLFRALGRDRMVAWRSFVTGMAILSVLSVLAYQSRAAFGGAEENRVIISPGTVWMYYAPNAVWKVVLSVLPFLLVFLYAVYKKQVSPEYLFCIGLLGIDIIVEFLLVESGSRMMDGNFTWGRMSSMYIVNYFSLLLYFRLTQRERK